MLWVQIETPQLLKHLANYHDLMEARLEQDASSAVDAILQSQRQRDSALFEADVDETKWIYENYFPRFLRYSLIMTLVMILETQLVKLCDSIKVKRNLSVRSKDLKGDTLNQCKKFLESVAKLSLDQALWNRVIDVSKVRNCIVHSMGDIELSNDKNRLLDLVRANQGIAVGDTVFQGLERNTIFISSEYCAQSIQHVAMLFDNIFDGAGFGNS